MFRSLKLGKLFGIDLYVHGTFWLLPLFILFGGITSGDTARAAFDVSVVLAVFGCVALHEVGHAVAAGWYGVRTRDITLYPIGGVASLERMPEKPLQEVVIALAGPAVNVVIAAGLFAVLLASNAALPASWDSPVADVAETFVARLFFANVFLCLFNLLPAFPMDGGRVLRAALSLALPRAEATHWAVTVGSVVAGGFLLVALITFNVGLMILAVVVFLLGRAELVAVRHQEARRAWERAGGRIDDPFEPEPPTAGRFTGWKWDPLRRVWTEWHNGSPVREVHVT